jgi:ATP-binding protein involved in chromosome partitioning
MSLSKDQIREVLSGIDNPGADGDLVSSGALKWSTTCDTYLSIKLHLPPGIAPPVMDRLAKVVHQSLAARAAGEGSRVDSLIVEYVDAPGTVIHTSKLGALNAGSGKAAAPSAPTAPAASPGHTPIGGLNPAASRQPAPQGGAPGLPGVRHVIAVGAGKGGVGKSTVALNLAVGLARRGHSVGLLDADIYGPSMPTMLGLAAMQQAVHQGYLQPFLTHGIKSITMGMLVDPEKPLIWRGPMAHGAFKQLLEQTAWGELDHLIIDLPPGTGDISLTMAQMVQLSGAVIVCTPQKVAQDDAVRAARMFRQLGVDVLGVVENMSSFIGDDGKEYDIFGKGGAETMAQRLNVPFLGALPITMSLRANSDSGNPTANFTATDPAGVRLNAALDRMVTNFEGQLSLSSMRGGTARPTLTIN